MSLDPTRQEKGVILRQEHEEIPASESPETRILHALTDTLHDKQPELLDHFLGAGYLQAWAGVLIGAKPGEYAPADYNQFMLDWLQTADPEIAKRFDIIFQEEAVLAPQKTVDGQTQETRNWLVNREELIRLVNENGDLFGHVDQLSYDQAKDSITKMLRDPQKGHLATGLLYGYPRGDCEDWAELSPIYKLFAGKDSKKDLKGAGFGDKESEFLDKYALNDKAPYIIRKAAATLIGRRIKMTNSQKTNFVERTAWKDRAGSTMWTGFKRNAETAKTTLGNIDTAFKKTGMGNLVSSLTKR